MHDGQPTVRLYDYYTVKYRLTPNGNPRHHATYPSYEIFHTFWEQDEATIIRQYDPVEIFVEHRKEVVVDTPIRIVARNRI